MKAIFAAQLSLQTAGNNIANANVKGYSRQSVQLATDYSLVVPGVGYIGTGVKSTGIVRTVDELLQNRIQVQNQSLGCLKTENMLLSQIEAILNEPSDGGLAAYFTKFFGSLNDMSVDPVDPTLRSDVVITGQIVSDGFKTLAGKLDSLSNDIETQVSNKINKVNQLVKEIAELNKMITASYSSNMQANELLDKRDAIIEELNYIIDIDAVPDSKGTVSMLVDGRLIASNGYSTELETSTSQSGDVYIHLKNNNTEMNVFSGEIKELINQQRNVIPELMSKLDKLAGQLAYEFNRIHSTGIPLSGSFTSMKAENPVQDMNADGDLLNDNLNSAGLSFAPEEGSLFITVTNENTGEVMQTEIEIDPSSQSLAYLAGELNSVPHINAYADSSGRLTLHASDGYAFDFSPQLNAAPNSNETFGNSSAMITGSGSWPATMSAGDSFQITLDGTSTHTVTFPAGGTYTASDIAALINTQTGTNIASVADNELVLQSQTQGSSSSILITDLSGTPSTTLGLSTALETGAELGVSVELEGSYSGASNASWRFEASGSGTIGVTNGLTVTVYDEAGETITVLDVGEGYSPGDMIEIADGVKVSFSPGDINQTAGDFFCADVIADSDTSGILASLGLNTFFTGSTASDISVRQAIQDSPILISGSLTPVEGDNSNIHKFLELEAAPIEGLNSYSLIDYYSSVIGEVGLDKEWAEEMYDVQELIMTNLENQRSSVSGVSIDEELMNLEKYQQMLTAATRYLEIVNEMNDILMNIGH